MKRFLIITHLGVDDLRAALKKSNRPFVGKLVADKYESHLCFWHLELSGDQGDLSPDDIEAYIRKQHGANACLVREWKAP